MPSNHKTWDHSSSSTNHRACENASSNYKQQVHISSNHNALEHNLSNHKTSEHASSNHKSCQDYTCSNHIPKDHVSSANHNDPREHVYSNHHSKQQHISSNHKLSKHALPDPGLDSPAGGWTADGAMRWSPAHSRLTDREEEEDRLGDYTVDMRFQPLDSTTQMSPGPGPKSRLRPRGLRPVKEGSMDSVQMLDTLNVGAEQEEWPLHRDLTLSPPLKSQPITLEQDGEHLTLKSNSVSDLLVSD